VSNSAIEKPEPLATVAKVATLPPSTIASVARLAGVATVPVFYEPALERIELSVTHATPTLPIEHSSCSRRSRALLVRPTVASSHLKQTGAPATVATMATVCRSIIWAFAAFAGWPVLHLGPD
jgi:hypothetical protein